MVSICYSINRLNQLYHWALWETLLQGSKLKSVDKGPVWKKVKDRRSLTTLISMETQLGVGMNPNIKISSGKYIYQVYGENYSHRKFLTAKWQDGENSIRRNFCPATISYSKISVQKKFHAVKIPTAKNLTLKNLTGKTLSTIFFSRSTDKNWKNPVAFLDTLVANTVLFDLRDP